jgi:epoxyqueuosine reductase
MSSSKAAELSSHIRDEAKRLGFFKVGITSTRPLPLSAEYDEWLAQGMHGDMHYMARQAPMRKDPGSILKNARSMVVLAMNYYSGAELTNHGLHGKISRYAWGDDYHIIVRKKLRELQKSIDGNEPGVASLSYVDTGPVMEKVWGAESALGWIGKHSNLITREQGSWFFIGVILLDVELEYDSKERDHCGTCTRCIPACPTGAIVAPYVVDARLCISYLTIELRGPIPLPLRPLIGNRIFGCDDCQEVCPWNRFAVQTGEAGFSHRAGNYMPELLSLSSITPEEFEVRFKNSPVRRAKRDGFVRNVMVALGNSRSPEALPGLQLGIRDPSALVRGHAAWALKQIPGPAARQVLEQARLIERDPTVLREMS